MDSEWLTVEDVAEYLKVSKTTVYRWTYEGKIKTYKIGRFNRYKKDEIDKVMESGSAE